MIVEHSPGHNQPSIDNLPDCSNARHQHNCRRAQTKPDHTSHKPYRLDANKIQSHTVPACSMIQPCTIYVGLHDLSKFICDLAIYYAQHCT